MIYMVFFFILFNRISAIMDHVQTFYFLESMVTKLHFTTLSMDHSSGYTFKANGKGLEYVKNTTLKCFIQATRNRSLAPISGGPQRAKRVMEHPKGGFLKKRQNDHHREQS